MSINNLSQYLEKFKAVFTPLLIKDPIIECIYTYTNIRLDKKNVNVKEKILHITAHPSHRNEIYMKKGRILKELGLILGTEAPRDIR